MLKRFFKGLYRSALRSLLIRNSWVIRLFYQNFYHPKYPSIAGLFDRYSKGHKAIYFIQIGANDGFQNDPLCKFIKRDRWKGILLEPQQAVSEQLAALHKNSPEVKVENAAVSHQNEIRPLYKLSFSNKRWATGIATFERPVLQKQIDNGYVAKKAKKEGESLPPDPADYITEEQVTCLTFNTLLKKHAVKHIDILQIDTEGFDYEIIKMLDLEKIKPVIISFEKEHLSEADFAACKEYLVSYGYRLFVDGRDAAAVQEEVMRKYELKG